MRYQTIFMILHSKFQMEVGLAHDIKKMHLRLH